MSLNYGPLLPWSVQLFERGLLNLELILVKARQQAEHRGYPGELLLQSRFYPDMYELSQQIQRVSDIALSTTSQLLGQAESVLQAEGSSLSAYIRLLQQSRQQLLRWQQAAEITAPVLRENRSEQWQVPDWASELQRQVLPNFYFHLTTAYNLLRHNGVAIGKADFLGAQP